MEARSKECPACHLLAPPSAERCDCGYSFSAGLVVPGASLPRRPRVHLRKWEKALLGAVASVILLVGASFTWFVLTAGAGSTTILSSGATQLGPQWTLLTPREPVRCERPRLTVLLTFPGQRDRAQALSKLESLSPEVAIVDSVGREYFSSGFAHTTVGTDVALTFLLSGAPDKVTIRSVKVRAAEGVSVPEVALGCHNDGL